MLPPGVIPPPGGIIPPPFPNIPRLCILCPLNIRPPKWSIDLHCRGPLCKHIGPRGGGLCKILCNLLKCRIGCKKKGGGHKRPPPDPEDPGEYDDEDYDDEDDDQCETTKTATQITAMCNIFTQWQVMGMGSGSTLSAPQTTCTSTKRRVTQGCAVVPLTTTIFDSCTKTQTATDFTKYCTESVSNGVTFTPCTRTVSTVFEGCSVTATTTSVIDDSCQAEVTLAPDDPQGEFGTLPDMSSNETCPYFPGVNVTVLDDQGTDGQQNGTCQPLNGTRTTMDDDQGDNDGKQSCQLNNGTMADGGTGSSCPVNNATMVQGPDGAEVGNMTNSCPLNNTIILEPDGAMDNDTSPSCDNPALSMNLTMEQDLGQGEDGVAEQSCALPSNSTLEVDNDQGEDSEHCEDEEQCVPK
jgi:hypothetical protein